MEAVPGVAIIGTIAAGKTTIAEALSELLHARGMRHALIDVDWLGQVYPPPEPQRPYSLDLAFTNLEATTPNFIAAGAEYFVIAVTLTCAEELDALRRAVSPVELSVCLLDVSPEVIAQRITARNRGSLRADFLSRTDALAEQIRQSGIADLRVANDRRPPAEVAEDALGRLRWQ